MNARTQNHPVNRRANRGTGYLLVAGAVLSWVVFAVWYAVIAMAGMAATT